MRNGLRPDRASRNRHCVRCRNPRAPNRRGRPPPRRNRDRRAPNRHSLPPLCRRERRRRKRNPSRSAWCRGGSAERSLSRNRRLSPSRRRRASRPNRRAHRTCRNSCCKAMSRTVMSRVLIWRSKRATGSVPRAELGRHAAGAIGATAAIRHSTPVPPLALTATMRHGARCVCPGVARRLFRSPRACCWLRQARLPCGITKSRRHRRRIRSRNRRRRRPQRR